MNHSRHCYYSPPPIRERSIVITVRVCVRACMCECVFHRLTTLLLRKLSLILLTLCCLIMTFVTLQMWFISEHVECITSTYMHLAQSSCVACLMYIMSDEFNRSSSCR